MILPDIIQRVYLTMMRFPAATLAATATTLHINHLQELDCKPLSLLPHPTAGPGATAGMVKSVSRV